MSEEEFQKWLTEFRYICRKCGQMCMLPDGVKVPFDIIAGDSTHFISCPYPECRGVKVIKDSELISLFKTRK